MEYSLIENKEEEAVGFSPRRSSSNSSGVGLVVSTTGGPTVDGPQKPRSAGSSSSSGHREPQMMVELRNSKGTPKPGPLDDEPLRSADYTNHSEESDTHHDESAPEFPGSDASDLRDGTDPGVLADGWPHYLRTSLRTLLIGEPGDRPWLNVLMVLTPFAMISDWADWGPGPTFTLSLLALAPFAERLGFVTEQMAMYTNDTVGGLLNATFGNATEMIVSLFALGHGLLRVVQVSLLGSILSNLLLVLGCAFFFGGLRYSVQQFNKTAAGVNSGLLLLAVMGLLFPAVLDASHTEIDENSGLSLSRLSAVGLLMVYICYLVFQLRTHQHLFEEEDDGGDDDGEKILGFWGAIAWLGVITLFISLLTEHASAVIFARRNKMDISVGVAIGSSTQIALLVIPFCVVVGWIIGQPLSLNFHIFETAAVMITVLIVSFIIHDGSSNWLTGLMLVVAYGLVAVSFLQHT